MALAFDAASSGSTTGTSHSHSHTCTGSNRILVIAISVGTSDDDITGVTYNSVSATLINKVQHTGTSRWSYLYFLVAPATGSNTIQITKTVSTAINASAVSYTGASQTGQPDAQNTQTTAGDALILTLNSVANNCWKIGYWRSAGVTMAAGTNTTNRVSVNTLHVLGDSNQDISGAFDMTGDSGTGGPVSGNAVTIAPVAGATTGASTAMLMGV